MNTSCLFCLRHCDFKSFFLNDQPFLVYWDIDDWRFGLSGFKEHSVVDSRTGLDWSFKVNDWVSQSGATYPGLIGLEQWKWNGTPQSPKATALLKLYHQIVLCYVQDTQWVGYYPSVGIQSVYSAASANWANSRLGHSFGVSNPLLWDAIGVLFYSPSRLGVTIEFRAQCIWSQWNKLTNQPTFKRLLQWNQVTLQKDFPS